MESLVQVIVPFITIVILSSIIDQVTKFLEVVMNKIPGLPDEFEWYIGYIIVVILSYFVTTSGEFDLFRHLGLNFGNHIGEFITALVISGGSSFVNDQFTLIARIPTIFQEFTNIFSKKDSEIEPEILNEDISEDCKG